MQLAHDIAQRGLAYTQLLRQRGKAPLLHAGGQAGKAAGADVLQAVAQRRQQGLGRVVAFGVYGGGVQRVFAVAHAQEAGALFKRPGPQLGHLFELGAALDAVFLTVGHDVFGQRRTDARHMGQQRRRGGAHLHAHAVDAALHHAVQRLLQLAFLQIMLILPHADGLGVDLDQLGQRVLHAAGDADRAAERHIKLRELLRRQLAGRVHGRARLADDHIGRALWQLGQKRGDELLGLARGGAVADGDGRDPEAPAQVDDVPAGARLGGLLPRQGEMAHARGEHLAVFIHHGQLAARAEAGVHAQRDAALDRRGHEQLVQVFAEHLNGAGAGAFGQIGADLPLDAGLKQAVPRVLRGQSHLSGGHAAGADERLFHHAHAIVPVQAKRYLEKALALAPVHGQHAVGGQVARLLGKIVVGGVDAVLLAGVFALQHAGAHGQRAQGLAHVGVVAHLLGQDVARALEGVLRRLHALFGVHKGLGQLLRRAPGFVLHQQRQCQRLQPLFPRDGGAGAALGTEGAVEVLQLGQGGGLLQPVGKLIGEIPLLLQSGGDLAPALVQPAQVLQALVNLAQQLVVQRPGLLLAVAGDKGNGVAVVNQAQHVFALLGLEVKLLTKGLNDVHWMHPFRIQSRKSTLDYSTPERFVLYKRPHLRYDRSTTAVYGGER